MEPAQICVARSMEIPPAHISRNQRVSRLFGAFSAGRGFPGFPAWFRRRIRGGGLPGFPAWFRRRIGADDCAMEDEWLDMKEVAVVVGRVPQDVPLKMRLPRKHRKTEINNILKSIYVDVVPFINTCLFAARAVFENPTSKNVVKNIEVIRETRSMIESYSRSVEALINEAQVLGERIFYIPRVHQYALSFLSLKWPTWPTVDMLHDNAEGTNVLPDDAEGINDLRDDAEGTNDLPDDAEGTNDQDVPGAGNDKAEVYDLVKAGSIGSEAEAGAHKAPEKQGGPIISAGSSSKGESSGSSFDPPQHEKDDMDELARANFVYSMFPNVSRDSIDELLKANDFDINRTVEMLEARVARANLIYSMFPNVSINELELTIDMLRVLHDNVEGINNLPDDAEASNDLNDDTDVPGAGNDKAEVYDPVKAGSVGAEAEAGAHKAPEKQGGPIISAGSSSKGESSGSSFDPAQHEEDDMDKLARANFVYSMFPNVSRDSIDELLKANDFDINRTVEVLQATRVARANLIYSMFPNVSTDSIDELLKKNGFELELTIDMLHVLHDNVEGINNLPDDAEASNDLHDDTDVPGEAEVFDPTKAVSVGPEAEAGAHKAPEKQGGPIISAGSSSKGESSGSSFDPPQHEEDDMDKKARLNFVYSMFPNVSTYSIDELLKANDFDMNRTVRMLCDNAKASNALHDDKDVLGADNQKAEVSDPIKARVNLVYAMFPNVSSNSIDELLEANDFDIEQTIDVLHMLDNAGDINMVYARFPNDSREFIDELLKANDFDIELTIAMLDEMNSPP